MNQPSDVFDGAEARIINRGYRRYDGERSGVSGAVRSVVRHSVQRGLGMRRTIWAKVPPVLTAAIAYIPAVVFVGIIALIPARNLTDLVLPTYGAYYGYVISAIVLFVAFAAPEMLCTDRRSGMLGIYLASPLNRDTYLLAKALAVAATLSIVCIGPPLLMLVANVMQNQGPDGFGDIVLTLVRVLVAGTMLTLMFTSVTMGVASLTDRKSIATAGIILLMLVSVMVAGMFSAATKSDLPLVASILTLSLDLGPRVHNEAMLDSLQLSNLTVYLAWLAWTVAGFTIARLRIHSLPVTR
ncbi:MAG: ABC transporter permease subunit [Microthrixaceae bacterium]|nr:ABC transporter permease subunit [Microthrixaceae bacterium]